jgi:hypothetical protein
MTMNGFDDTRIRRRPDGSIDTGYYSDRARHFRSDHARDMFLGPQGGAMPKRTPRRRGWL